MGGAERNPLLAAVDERLLMLNDQEHSEVVALVTRLLNSHLLWTNGLETKAVLAARVWLRANPPSQRDPVTQADTLTNTSIGA